MQILTEKAEDLRPSDSPVGRLRVLPLGCDEGFSCFYLRVARVRVRGPPRGAQERQSSQEGKDNPRNRHLLPVVCSLGSAARI